MIGELKRPGAGTRRASGLIRNRRQFGTAARGEQDRRREALEAAKAKVSVFAAWRALGLPGDPRRSCRSPLCEDWHLSFPGFQYLRSLREHAAAEFGDAPTCVRQALASGRVEVFRWVLELSDGVLPWLFGRALYFKSSVSRARGGGA
jgi:hypothetical protein